MPKGRNQGRTRRVFLTHAGSGPWACYFCGIADIVGFTIALGGHLHHVDHDASNDAPENIVPAHGVCHNAYHGAQPRNTPATLTEAHKRAIGDGVRGTVQTAQARANSSAAARRRYTDPTERAAQSNRMRALRKPCPCGCGEQLHPLTIKKHLRNRN